MKIISKISFVNHVQKSSRIFLEFSRKLEVKDVLEEEEEEEKFTLRVGP